MSDTPAVPMTALDDLIRAARDWGIEEASQFSVPSTLESHRKEVDDLRAEIELARSGPPSESPQLRTFAEWVRDVDPTTTTWPRAKQWAVLALAGVDSVGQLFDPSDDPDDDA